ncbi:MAG TPA: DUF6188 family protein [Terriglobales bacterium]|nr:DUF6188 family protein [Terriglobales bacterium]
MERALANAPDRYEIPIQSRSVTRLYVQSGFDLQIFEDASETTIRIDDPIAVVSENPKPLAKLESDDGLTPSLGVFGKIVVSGSALRRDERMLEIVFHPGVWFWVEPTHEQSEWGPYGSKGVILICMPGSEMAVWFGIRRPASVTADYDSHAVAAI